MAFRDFVIDAASPRSPCDGCEKRRVGCHAAGECEAYDKFAADRKNAYRYRLEEQDINDYADKRIREIKKRGGKRTCLKKK